MTLALSLPLSHSHTPHLEFSHKFSIINESHRCVTLAASLAARQRPTSMAAFQVCLQVWLAMSLLADGLAVAGQNWNGIRTLGVPKELMTTHGRHRSYSFILGLGFSGVS
ncbi:hypothetical protein AAZX31_16G096500 [Glycine max]